MLRISAQTKLSPEKVIERAETFFGRAGQGLETKDRASNCISFQGGGGMVEINTCVENKQTTVEIATQEWDFQVKEFIGKLPS